MVHVGWKDLSLSELIQHTSYSSNERQRNAQSEPSSNQTTDTGISHGDDGLKKRRWRQRRRALTDEIQLIESLPVAHEEQYASQSTLVPVGPETKDTGVMIHSVDLAARAQAPFSRRNEKRSSTYISRIQTFWKAKEAKVWTLLGPWYNEYILHLLLRRARISHMKNQRKIDLDISRIRQIKDDRTGKPYISNRIRSARYTIWNFIPFQIIFQMQKASNVYFLATAILGMFSGFSTTGKFTNLVPLLVFWTLTIAREGYDDFKRYRMDKTENGKQTQSLCMRCPDGCVDGQGPHAPKLTAKQYLLQRKDIRRRKPQVEDVSLSASETTFTDSLRDSQTDKDGGSPRRMWSSTKWIDLEVGSIIKLHRDEEVPADIVLLYADGRNGMAYVETMALDGETNLKTRTPPLLLAKSCREVQTMRKCHAHFKVEDPNPELYNFDGTVTLDNEKAPLTLKNVIYRGCTVRNTNTVLGLVINTGEECKIRMNANLEPQAKAPAMQRIANYLIIALAAFVGLLTLVSSLLYAWWTRTFEIKAWYLEGAHYSNAETVIGLAIEYNNIVPLALFISMEILRFAQLALLHDIEMYDTKSNAPMVCNTQSLFENLGQIGHIFSDKTGTLTQNVMCFKKMSVGGLAWEHTPDDRSTVKDGISGIPKLSGEMKTSELQMFLRTNEDNAAKQTYFLLLAMALCHTCYPELSSDGKITYQAESPDEFALVEAANELGTTVLDRSDRSITILPGFSCTKPTTYEILDVIEFSTSRKRMSIFVRLEDGSICLFCKGADSVMQKRIKQSLQKVNVESSSNIALNNKRATNGLKSSASNPSSQITVSTTEIDMEEQINKNCFADNDRFATEGFRTLIYGHRIISDEEYAVWKRGFQHATTSLENRQQMIETAAELIEKDFKLTGVTAIEDKLQEHVPETIDKLRRANIKIWMLTGDKRETAINIAHSAHICKPNSEVVILHHKSAENTASIEDRVRDVAFAVNRSVKHCVLVFDGQTLAEMDDYPDVRYMFYDMILQLDAVICCRASPSQKASIVKNVRHRVKMPLTLAIGDGGNDIAMIKEAHVGIGISGKEGLQASRVADYSIAQFRFLQRLILVHGHWNYIRIAKFIILTFWKEMMFYWIQVLYQYWNGFTGTSIYETTFLTVWNTLFSSLCVLVPGIFEQDLSASTLLAVPEVYVYGQQDRAFNLRKCAFWMLGGVIQGTWIWLLVYTLYGIVQPMSDQRVYAIGDLAATACVVFVNFKLLILHYHHKSWIPLASFAVTVIGWFAWTLLFSFAWKGYLGPEDLYMGFLQHFGRELTWWAILGLTLVGSTVGEVVVDLVQREYWPSVVDMWQELEQDGEIRKRLEEEAESKGLSVKG